MTLFQNYVYNFHYKHGMESQTDQLFRTHSRICLARQCFILIHVVLNHSKIKTHDYNKKINKNNKDYEN